MKWEHILTLVVIASFIEAQQTLTFPPSAFSQLGSPQQRYIISAVPESAPLQVLPHQFVYQPPQAGFAAQLPAGSPLLGPAAYPGIYQAEGRLSSPRPVERGLAEVNNELYGKLPEEVLGDLLIDPTSRRPERRLTKVVRWKKARRDRKTLLYLKAQKQLILVFRQFIRLVKHKTFGTFVEFQREFDQFFHEDQAFFDANYLPIFRKCYSRKRRSFRFRRIISRIVSKTMHSDLRNVRLHILPTSASDQSLVDDSELGELPTLAKKKYNFMIPRGFRKGLRFLVRYHKAYVRLLNSSVDPAEQADILEETPFKTLPQFRRKMKSFLFLFNNFKEYYAGVKPQYRDKELSKFLRRVSVIAANIERLQIGSFYSAYTNLPHRLQLQMQKRTNLPSSIDRLQKEIERLVASQGSDSFYDSIFNIIRMNPKLRDIDLRGPSHFVTPLVFLKMLETNFRKTDFEPLVLYYFQIFIDKQARIKEFIFEGNPGLSDSVTFDFQKFVFLISRKFSISQFRDINKVMDKLDEQIAKLSGGASLSSEARSKFVRIYSNLFFKVFKKLLGLSRPSEFTIFAHKIGISTQNFPLSITRYQKNPFSQSIGRNQVRVAGKVMRRIDGLSNLFDSQEDLSTSTSKPEFLSLLNSKAKPSTSISASTPGFLSQKLQIKRADLPGPNPKVKLSLEARQVIPTSGDFETPDGKPIKVFDVGTKNSLTVSSEGRSPVVVPLTFLSRDHKVIKITEWLLTRVQSIASLFKALLVSASPSQAREILVVFGTLRAPHSSATEMIEALRFLFDPILRDLDAENQTLLLSSAAALLSRHSKRCHVRLYGRLVERITNLKLETENSQFRLAKILLISKNLVRLLNEGTKWNIENECDKVERLVFSRTVLSRTRIRAAQLGEFIRSVPPKKPEGSNQEEYPDDQLPPDDDPNPPKKRHPPVKRPRKRKPPVKDDPIPPQKRRPPVEDDPIPPQKRRPPVEDDPIPPQKRRPPVEDDPIPPQKRRPPVGDDPIPPPKKRPPVEDDPIPPPKKRPPVEDDPIPPPKKKLPPVKEPEPTPFDRSDLMKMFRKFLPKTRLDAKGSGFIRDLFRQILVTGSVSTFGGPEISSRIQFKLKKDDLLYLMLLYNRSQKASSVQEIFSDRRVISNLKRIMYRSMDPPTKDSSFRGFVRAVVQSFVERVSENRGNGGPALIKRLQYKVLSNPEDLGQFKLLYLRSQTEPNWLYESKTETSLFSMLSRLRFKSNREEKKLENFAQSFARFATGRAAQRRAEFFNQKIQKKILYKNFEKIPGQRVKQLRGSLRKFFGVLEPTQIQKIKRIIYKKIKKPPTLRSFRKKCFRIIDGKLTRIPMTDPLYQQICSREISGDYLLDSVQPEGDPSETGIGCAPETGTQVNYRPVFNVHIDFSSAEAAEEFQKSVASNPIFNAIARDHVLNMPLLRKQWSKASEKKIFSVSVSEETTPYNDADMDELESIPKDKLMADILESFSSRTQDLEAESKAELDREESFEKNLSIIDSVLKQAESEPELPGNDELIDKLIKQAQLESQEAEKVERNDELIERLIKQAELDRQEAERVRAGPFALENRISSMLQEQVKLLQSSEPQDDYPSSQPNLEHILAEIASRRTEDEEGLFPDRELEDVQQSFPDIRSQSQQQRIV